MKSWLLTFDRGPPDKNLDILSFVPTRGRVRPVDLRGRRSHLGFQPHFSCLCKFCIWKKIHVRCITGLKTTHNPLLWEPGSDIRQIGGILNCRQRFQRMRWRCRTGQMMKDDRSTEELLSVSLKMKQATRKTCQKCTNPLKICGVGLAHHGFVLVFRAILYCSDKAKKEGNF